jgi:hypothetical protein
MIGALAARYQPEWLERVRLGAPLWVGPTGEVALTTQFCWKPRTLFMLLTMQLDEANTHDEAEIMVMGGWLGRLGQWNRFDHKWKKALRKSGLDHFHAQEMPRHPFGMKAQGIPDDCLMAGFVVRLDRKDYKEVYRNGPWGGKAQPDSMYGLCFRYCLSAALEIGTHEYPSDLKLNFIVESGHSQVGAANEIVERIKRQKIAGVSEFLGTVTPMGKRESYGLQAADGLATGAAWTETPTGSTIPLLAVSPAGRLMDVYPKSLTKAPIFRCHIDREQAANYRDDMFEFHRLRQQFGQQRAAEIQARKEIARKGGAL